MSTPTSEIVSMLHDYSKQSRTIGSFSATAELIQHRITTRGTEIGPEETKWEDHEVLVVLLTLSVASRYFLESLSSLRVLRGSFDYRLISGRPCCVYVSRLSDVLFTCAA